MDALYEFMVMKTIKFLSIIGAWTFAQAAQMADGIISKSFDQLFSIGLLLVFLITLWKEYKANQKILNQRAADNKAVEKELLEDIKEVLHKINEEQINNGK